MKRWTIFNSQRFGIAVNINGTVVVKGSDPGKFLLWIRPDGTAGTNSKNQLTCDHLANVLFIDVLVEVVERLQAWVGQVGGREFPRGPVRLLRRAVVALKFREEAFLSDEASCRFIYKTLSTKWPF